MFPVENVRMKVDILSVQGAKCGNEGAELCVLKPNMLAGMCWPDQDCNFRVLGIAARLVNIGLIKLRRCRRLARES